MSTTTYGLQPPYTTVRTPPEDLLNGQYSPPSYLTVTQQSSLDYKPAFIDGVRDPLERPDTYSKAGEVKAGMDVRQGDEKQHAVVYDVGGATTGRDVDEQGTPSPFLLSPAENPSVAELTEDNGLQMPFSSSPVDEDQPPLSSLSSLTPSQSPSRAPPVSSPRPLPTYNIEARPISISLSPSSPSPNNVSGIPLSPNTRAQAQHPTYITPPSSPKPMRSTPARNSTSASVAASAAMAYSSYPSSPGPMTPDPMQHNFNSNSINTKNRAPPMASPSPYYPPQVAQQMQYRSAPSPSFPPDVYQMQQGTPEPRGLPTMGPVNVNGLGVGREICIECAMRDQDMADVDVTSPGVWERESDVYYRDLCSAEELDVAQGRSQGQGRGRSSNSGEASREGEGEDDTPYSIVVSPTAGAIWSRPGERPRSRGNRLTEGNLKLWLTMNPREPQARQQTLELYVKTQRSLLQAESLARARAMQESRAIDDKVKDAYEHLRRSTGELGEDDSMQQVQSRTRSGSGKGHSPRRSTLSGGTPVLVSPGGGAAPLVVDSVGSAGVYGHGRHQSANGREVTLLENGMIVEHMDVRKEEKERRREERRERRIGEKREKSRKGDRTSVAGGVGLGLGTVGSGADIQGMDSGFHTSASTSDRERDGARPMSRYSASLSSTRAMSVPMPLSPPPSSAPSTRPPNTRLQSQVSLADTQSIVSSISGGAGLYGGPNSARRSRFFAFRNWSEAWKSRESFATGATNGISGSMMDMHVALDNERYNKPSPIDLSSASYIAGGDNMGTNIQQAQQQWPRRSVSDNLLGAQNDTFSDKSTKKRKGLAKIWKLVTGQGTSHSSKNQSKATQNMQQRGREIQPIPRSEDDFPLAPPPPLSYLVNRASIAVPARERTLSASTSTPRRTSTPSSGIPTLGSAASVTLPTPTSIRNPWQEQDSVGEGYSAGGAKTYGGLPVHIEESNNGYQDGMGGVDPDFARTVHPVASEPDMRQRIQDVPSFRASMMAATSPQGSMSSRPISVYSLHKSLPPLPPGEAVPPHSEQKMPLPADQRRPQTMYDLMGESSNSSTIRGNGGDDTMRLPDPSFKREGRRQSFGGISGHPDLLYNGADASFASSTGKKQRFPQYDDLGSPSLGRIGTADCSSLTLPKRRSRFGLSSLLEKIGGGSAAAKEARRSMTPTPSTLGVYEPPPGTASSRPSMSELHTGSVSPEFGYGNGPASSRSRHGARASRLSVASRKAIEELVDQDPDFVAYRYPSADQSISVLTQ